MDPFGHHTPKYSDAPRRRRLLWFCPKYSFKRDASAFSSRPRRTKGRVVPKAAEPAAAPVRFLPTVNAPDPMPFAIPAQPGFLSFIAVWKAFCAPPETSWLTIEAAVPPAAPARAPREISPTVGLLDS